MSLLQHFNTSVNLAAASRLAASGASPRACAATAGDANRDVGATGTGAPPAAPRLGWASSPRMIVDQPAAAVDLAPGVSPTAALAGAYGFNALEFDRALGYQVSDADSAAMAERASAHLAAVGVVAKSHVAPPGTPRSAATAAAASAAQSTGSESNGESDVGLPRDVVPSPASTAASPRVRGPSDSESGGPCGGGGPYAAAAPAVPGARVRRFWDSPSSEGASMGSAWGGSPHSLGSRSPRTPRTPRTPGSATSSSPKTPMLPPPPPRQAAHVRNATVGAAVAESPTTATLVAGLSSVTVASPPPANGGVSLPLGVAFSPVRAGGRVPANTRRRRRRRSARDSDEASLLPKGDGAVAGAPHAAGGGEPGPSPGKRARIELTSVVGAGPGQLLAAPPLAPDSTSSRPKGLPTGASRRRIVGADVVSAIKEGTRNGINRKGRSSRRKRPALRVQTQGDPSVVAATARAAAAAAAANVHARLRASAMGGSPREPAAQSAPLNDKSISPERLEAASAMVKLSPRQPPDAYIVPSPSSASAGSATSPFSAQRGSLSGARGSATRQCASGERDRRNPIVRPGRPRRRAAVAAAARVRSGSVEDSTDTEDATESGPLVSAPPDADPVPEYRGGHPVCTTAGCEVRARYGRKAGSRPFLCASHGRRHGCVDVYKAICLHEECTTEASWGEMGPGGRPLRQYCTVHAREVNEAHVAAQRAAGGADSDSERQRVFRCGGVCEVATCATVAKFGFVSEGRRRRCSAHQQEGMVNLSIAGRRKGGAAARRRAAGGSNSAPSSSD